MPEYHRIDPLRFEAAVKDPSPFVIVVGDRRSGKTEFIKQRMPKEFGSHNVMLMHHRDMRGVFDDIKEHIERFYTNPMDLRGIDGSDKNLYIDEFSYINDIDRFFNFKGWKSITMASSIHRINSFDLSRFDQASFHDWYSPTALPRLPMQELSSSMKFRLMAGTCV